MPTTTTTTTTSESTGTRTVIFQLYIGRQGDGERPSAHVFLRTQDMKDEFCLTSFHRVLSLTNLPGVCQRFEFNIFFNTQMSLFQAGRGHYLSLQQRLTA